MQTYAPRFARASSPSRFAARSDFAFIDEARRVAFKERPLRGQSAKMARFAGKRRLLCPAGDRGHVLAGAKAHHQTGLTAERACKKRDESA